MPPSGFVRRWRFGVTAVVMAVITIGAGSLACTVSDSPRLGHGSAVDGRGILTGSFPPQCVEIDDTPVVVAWILRRGGVPRRARGDRPPPCLML